MVDTEVREGRVGGLRRLVVRGPGRDCFRALGEAARADIRGMLTAMPEVERLRARTTTSRGRARFRAVREATRAAYGGYLDELRAMSEGAAVSFEDLLLLNLRGDVGAGDAAGCSDLGWRRERSFVAHNEDGAPEAAAHMTLLTLCQDGRVPVTALWYPGFVPANAFTVTGHGLVCGNDHIPVEPPAIGPGRHFVARGLSAATDLDAAVQHLRTHPGAGGFTYTLGECGTGRVAVVECAGGEVAVTELGEKEPLRWHTNHLREIPPPAPRPGAVAQAGAGAPAPPPEHPGCSAARGERLNRLRAPATGPDAEWFLQVLTGRHADGGVFRDGSAGDTLATLASMVADLTGDRLTVRGPSGPAETVPLAAFARGASTHG